MRATIFVFLVLAACVPLPHVEPAPRSPSAAAAAAIRLGISCDDAATNVTERSATGVVISERHVLTAAHAVECMDLPTIRVTMRDGRPLRLAVERDDATFGEGRDLARLVIRSAEYFDLGLAPPAIRAVRAGPPEVACAAVLRNKNAPIHICGQITPPDPDVVGDATIPGDSGAGVYDAQGALLGLAVRSARDGSFFRIEYLDGSWLEGT